MRKSAFLLTILATIASNANAQSTDALQQGFHVPPVEARPWVWWHWMNGNVTRDGIAKDLEWFTQVGVGGFTAFDGAGAVPRFVEKPLIYMDDAWKEAFRFAMAEADRRGMEASIAASPGWSQSGGPWVKPEQAMKKYVWTETWVEGGRRFTGRLPQPADVAGGFQDTAVTTRSKPPAFYRDASVFAYRVDDAQRSQAELAPTITTQVATDPSGTTLARAGEQFVLDAARLANGKLTDPVILAPSTAQNPAVIDIAYKAPVTVRGVTLANGVPFPAGWALENGPIIRVEADDGSQGFRTIAEGLYSGSQRTFAFPATTARSFRVVILPATPFVPPRPAPTPRSPTTPGNVMQPVVQAAAPVAPAAPAGFALAELVMRQVAPVEQFEVKAGFGVSHDYYAIPTLETGGAVRARDVIDLTARMSPDGTLDWQPPAGRWVVVRLGYGLTGKENGPASEEATGLEVDKLNAEHVRAYVNQYLDMYASATGPDLIGKRGLRAILNDSYEARFQNWTENMLGEFRSRRGYDPAPYLPVLTGVVVESAATSDRFLWDWRRTIFDLLAQSHYKVIAEEARKRGMIAYAEALEDNRAYHGDDMEMRQHADIPMGAMGPGTSPGEGTQAPTRRYVDAHGAASVAHVYGRPFVAAESFTSVTNDRSPREIKTVADQLFLHGVNRIFVHTSAHQPTDQGPGATLNNIGFFFTRNEPWAGMARAWTDYLARTSYLLQQGRYVADFAYFYGEEAPITGIWGSEPDKALPTGRGYDFVNADVVLNYFSVRNGRVVTPSGMEYALIFVGGRSSQMTLPVLSKLKALVEQGASVAGERPMRSPSLADDDAAFQRAADSVWGNGERSVRIVGKGRVFVGFNADDALTRIGVFRDLMYVTEPLDEAFDAIHRKLDDGDLYYVINKRGRDFSYDISLRASGRNVELWDPVTGEIKPASYRTENGRTILRLSLNGAGSVFVVMRGEGAPSRVVAVPQERTTKVLDGAWTVSFQASRGAPAQITLPSLISLSEHADPGVRYFSGVATYTKALELATGPEAGQSYFLDLGQVEDMASVRVNGTEIGTVWRPPFRVDITRALKRGSNDVAIEVANTWKNRLIGDQQPGMTQVSFAPSAAESADTPLLRSGLIGPVRLIEAR